MDNIIGLMGAMEDEIAPLAACMEAKENIPLGGITFTSGLLGGKKTVLCCAGVGKAQAAAATQLLCTHFGATAIVFSGIAGNMTDKIGVGDVCLGGTVVYQMVSRACLPRRTRTCGSSILTLACWPQPPQPAKRPG